MNLTDIDSYPWPETQYERITQSMEARSIREGDRFKGVIVGSNKVGTKWAEVRSEEGRLIERLLADTEVDVQRRRETEYSRTLYSRAYRNRKIAEQLSEDQLEDVRTYQQKLNTHLEKYGFVDYDVVANLLEVQASARLWRRFVSIVEHYQKLADEGKFEGDLAEIFGIYKGELTKDLLSRYSNRALSRSTSVMSNIYADVDREAISRFLEGDRWF